MVQAPGRAGRHKIQRYPFRRPGGNQEQNQKKADHAGEG